MKIQNINKEEINVTEEEITRAVNELYREKDFFESIKKINEEKRKRENLIAGIIGIIGTILIVLYIILAFIYKQ